MALENDVQNLVDQIRDLVQTMGSLGTGGSTAGSDRVVAAIAKLAVQLDKNTRGRKEEDKKVEKFVKEVDGAAKAAADNAKAQSRAADDIEQAAKTQTDAQKRSARSLKEEYQSRQRNIDYGRELAKLTYSELVDKAKLSSVSRALGNTLSDKLGTDVVKTQMTMMALEKAADSASRAMGGFLLDVGGGNTSLATMNRLVDTFGDLLSGVLSAIPLFGGALAAATKATAEGAKFVIDQSQRAITSFNQLGQSGLLTAGGISELRDSSIKSGMTLENYNRLMTESSVALARFSGTAGDGRKRLSAIIGSIVDSDTGAQLRRLGMTADEIGEFTAGYISRQSRLGLAQNKTNEQLRQGSVRYIQELDQLTRITGLNRKELESQQETALSDARFRAAYDTLQSQGLGKQAETMLRFTTMFAKQPEIQKGFQDMASGLTNTDASLKLLRSTGGEAANIMERLKTGQIDEVTARQQLQQALKDNVGVQRDLAMVSDGANDAFINYSQVADIVGSDFKKSITDVVAAQNAQKTKGTDPLTDSAVLAQKSLDEMSRKMQAFAFNSMPAVMTAVSEFTRVLNQGLDKIGESLGIDLPGSPTGGGRRGGPSAAAARANRSYADTNEFAGMAEQGVGPAPSPMTQQGLADAGLKLRPRGGDIQQDGGEVSPKLIALAKKIQDAVPGFNYFSGFNDAYHQDKDSQHNKGMALDFTLNKAPSPEQGKKLVSMIQGMGGGQVLDEYNFPSPGATAGHIHVGIPEFAKGGIASGPKSGYQATLHGTEAVVPLPDGKSIPVAAKDSPNIGQQVSMLEQQIMRLDDMIDLMRKQTNISEKILQVSYS